MRLGKTNIYDWFRKIGGMQWFVEIIAILLQWKSQISPFYKQNIIKIDFPTQISTTILCKIDKYEMFNWCQVFLWVFNCSSLHWHFELYNCFQTLITANQCNCLKFNNIFSKSSTHQNGVFIFWACSHSLLNVYTYYSFNWKRFKWKLVLKSEFEWVLRLTKKRYSSKYIVHDMIVMKHSKNMFSISSHVLVLI